MDNEKLTKIVINCETGESEEIELSLEEVEQLKIDRIAAEEFHTKQKEEEARIFELKESAKTKLISGQPLTEEEASLLII